MKKLLSMLAMIMMVLLSSAVLAKTPPGFYNIKDPAHIGLGGLKPLFSYTQVYNIYGEPTEIYRTKNPESNALFDEPL